MQLMPATARRFGVRRLLRRAPEHLRRRTQYLRFLLDLFQGDVTLALAALQRGRERGAALPRDPSLPGDPQYVAEGPGPPRGLRRASPRANAAVFFAPGSTAKALAPRRPGRSRPRRRRVQPARPRIYYSGATSAGSPRRARPRRPTARSTPRSAPWTEAHAPSPSPGGRSTRACSSPTSTRARSSTTAALRGGRARARGGLPAAPARRRVLNLLGLVYFKQEKLEQGGGGLPQAGRGEPRGPHAPLQPRAHLLQAEPAGGRGVRVPEGARARPGQPQDQLLPGLDLRAAAPLQGRDLPVPPGGRQPHGPARRGQDGRDRPADAAEHRGSSGPAEPAAARRRPRPGTTPRDPARRPSRDGRARASRRSTAGQDGAAVSESLLADEAAARRAGASDRPPAPTAHRRHDDRRRRRCASAAAQRAAAPGSDTARPRRRRPPARAEIFRFLENNLMEIDFAGKVFIKQGTIYSYSGNLTFWVKDKRPGGQPPLVIITGHRPADPHRPRPRDHLHAGDGRDGLRRARPPARLRGGPHAALRPPRRRRQASRCSPSRAGAWWRSRWRASRCRSASPRACPFRFPRPR